MKPMSTQAFRRRLSCIFSLVVMLQKREACLGMPSAVQMGSCPVVVGYVLPDKKLRMLAPLAQALERVGLPTTLHPLLTAHGQEKTLSHCDVLISHVKHLLGEEHRDDDAQRMLETLARWERLHPTTLVFDSLAVQRRLTARHHIASALAGMHAEGVVAGDGGRRWRLRSPKTLIWVPSEGGGVEGADAQGQEAVMAGSAEEEKLQKSLHDAGLEFPVVWKPLHDDGRPGSHELCIIWRPDMLRHRCGGPDESYCACLYLELAST